MRAVCRFSSLVSTRIGYARRLEAELTARFTRFGPRRGVSQLIVQNN